jgi:carbon-monoxide dehydrogenase large subunit
MNDATGPTKWIGQSVERLEDPPLVAGRGRFAGDINFPRQLHMRIVRSNHAHANIVSIFTEVARAVPGVVAVWTAQDIADVPPVDFREGPIERLAPYRQPVLAQHKVRYVGEPVAAVFAEDPYVAEDAADLVTMEVEELPPLLSAEDEPGEFSFARDTEATVLTQGYGDVEAVFKSAPHVVELKLTSGRHSGVPLETRGGGGGGPATATRS